MYMVRQLNHIGFLLFYKSSRKCRVIVRKLVVTLLHPLTLQLR